MGVVECELMSVCSWGRTAAAASTSASAGRRAPPPPLSLHSVTSSINELD